MKAQQLIGLAIVLAPILGVLVLFGRKLWKDAKALAADLKAHKGTAATKADIAALGSDAAAMVKALLPLLPEKEKVALTGALSSTGAAAALIGNEPTAPAKLTAVPPPLPDPPKQAGFARVGLLLALAAGLSALALAPRIARADGFSAGPTLPLVRWDATTHALSVLAPGAGGFAAYGLLPRVLHGQTYDLLSFELAGFVQHNQGVTSASASALVCTMSGLLCLGGGRDLYVSAGHADWFALASVSIALGLASSLASSGGSPGSLPVLGATAAPPPAPPGNEFRLPF